MRFLRFLALALVPLTALAAKKPATSTFDTYRTRPFPIELDEHSYDSITATPRDYYSAVLLTARPAKYACVLCRNFDPEWKILANSWQKADKKGDSRLLFTTLDFDNGRNVFMKLQLQTAPILFLFPPTSGPNAVPGGQPIRMDFLGEQSADSVHAWLTRQLPNDKSYPALKRPVNYTRILVSITILIGLFTFGTVAYPYVLPVIQSRNLWAAVSLITILLFTSGHMFNHIRKVPYVTGSKGKIVYFAGGFQNQYGMETQIVAAMCTFPRVLLSSDLLTATDAILAFATIALGLKVPRMTDPRMQQIACIIWAAVIFGMYSFLMSVFRIKNGGYPFWLPPF
jgi:oligosaccharyltransferase complex subunit gamma